MTDSALETPDMAELSGVPYEGIAAGDVLTLKAASIKASIDAAVLTEDGALVVAGWVYDPEETVQGFASLLKSGGLLKKGYSARHLTSGGVQWLPVDRPDVTAAHGSGEYHRHGFVLVVPRFSSELQLALVLKDQRYALLSYNVITSLVQAERTLELSMSSAGPQLYAGLQAGLGDGHELTRLVGDLLIQDVQQVRQLASCDQALLIDDKVLLLNGWIGSRSRDIKRVQLIIEGKSTDLTGGLSRYPRPDLNDAFPKAADEAMGYIVATPLSNCSLKQVEVQVSWYNGERESTRIGITRVGWPELHSYLQHHPNLFPAIMRQLEAACRYPCQDAIFATRLAKLHEMQFSFMAHSLPNMVEHPERAIVAIDRAFALGKAGILVYGWKLTPRHKPLDVTVHDERGNLVSVKESFLPLVREDVASAYRERFPAVSRRCGFILHIPLPTEVGDARAICFHYAERGDVWMRLPVDQRDTQGVALIKEMLGMIPNPGQLNHYLSEMFDGGLGTALEAVNQQRLANAPSVEETLESRQFGEPPAAPRTSIIVPLYGRCDFMRHQLAHFADDDEVRQSDLIYVVDDPSLVEEVLSLAARYQWLFNVPFRVVWYGRNLGFAGANNAGATLARADKLLLLNSDVMPQQAGWLGTLEAALDELPEAGAVGPLLQFGDGSIQHAGMHPRRDPQLPGFMLNTHPGMGQQWEEGSDTAYEQPLLTAACVMLRKTDYDSLGGFDEGYVIGDFEDSDLCLGLRTQGKCLYVVPEAKLWHLERQSQTLNSVAGVRQLITLFNGWRYQQKIARGELVNPMEIQIGQEARA